jgi:cobalt-zinc-cadmium efflux system outer membrane protein
MIRWCTNLMLVTAVAVAVPLCAQERPSNGLARRTPASTATRAVAGEPLVMRGAEPTLVPASEIAGASRQSLSLEYLTRLALENHPLLRRDAARIDSAAGQALQKGLYPNPRFDTNNPQVFNGKNSMFNLGFQQEIVVKGKLRLDRAAALRSQQQSELGLVQDKYGLLTALRSQFYTTLAAQYRVDVLNRLLKLTDASVRIAQERAKGGTGDQTEVLLLTIDFDRTRADLSNAQRVLAGEKGQLAAIVGFPRLVQENVVGSLAASPPRFDEPFMERFVASENVQVQIAKIDVDKSKILLQRAEAEPYPNVSLGPAYNYGLTKGNEQFWFNIIFPIPVSNRNQGNIISARAGIRDSMESLGSVQLDLLRQLADAFSAHRGALAQAEEYKEHIIPDARESLRLARSGFEVGLFDFSVYLQAQRTLIDSSKAYVDILERVWTTAATVGGLLQLDQFP